MKNLFNIFIFISLLINSSIALEVKVIYTSGDVKCRFGVEEHWSDVKSGIILKEIDTILTGKTGKVTLQFSDGAHFTLGANAILDIADLRKVNDQELFIFLMKMKVDKIEKKGEATPLRIGNVSVVHGTSKDTTRLTSLKSELETPERVKNGIIALFNQEFFPNTIMKIHKIKDEVELNQNCGELYFYLGKSFELIDHPGQALDAYQKVIKGNEGVECSQTEWVKQANAGIKRLQQQ
jgi:hypothetical protein